MKVNQLSLVHRVRTAVVKTVGIVVSGHQILNFDIFYSSFVTSKYYSFVIMIITIQYMI